MKPRWQYWRIWNVLMFGLDHPMAVYLIAAMRTREYRYAATAAFRRVMEEKRVEGGLLESA